MSKRVIVFLAFFSISIAPLVVYSSSPVSSQGPQCGVGELELAGCTQGELIDAVEPSDVPCGAGDVVALEAADLENDPCEDLVVIDDPIVKGQPNPETVAETNEPEQQQQVLGASTTQAAVAGASDEGSVLAATGVGLSAVSVITGLGVVSASVFLGLRKPSAKKD